MTRQTDEKSLYEQQEDRILAQSDAFISLLTKRGILGDHEIDNEKIRTAQKKRTQTSYGHSTGYHGDGESVDLYSYAEFDSFDNDDKYRMMDISARGSNRDGAALRYVAERLSKRLEAVKLLILVSDGQPAASGYYGTAAEEDLRGIKQEYQRKGILFIAAAIGNDKQNIERIYGDSFLDISDLTQLPTKLTNVVKRHIRV